jgi:hypothetical protein
MKSLQRFHLQKSPRLSYPENLTKTSRAFLPPKKTTLARLVPLDIQYHHKTSKAQSASQNFQFSIFNSQFSILNYDASAPPNHHGIPP